MNDNFRKEKDWTDDEKYKDFLKKNRDNNISFLNDFSYWLLIHIFAKNQKDLSSRNFDNIEDFCEEIEISDKKSKYISNLHDTLITFISSYVDLDVGCNYKTKDKQD